MPLYDIELEDGRIFEIETEDAPEKDKSLVQQLSKQPERVERSLAEQFQLAAPTVDPDFMLDNLKSVTSEQFQALPSQGISAFAPQIAGALAESPNVQAGIEGLRREESLFSAALEFGSRFKKQGVKQAFTGSLKTALDSVSGKKLQTLGNVFKDDLGFDDQTAAISGLIASMFLPSSIAAGFKGAKAAAKRDPVNVDTFIKDLKGGKQFKAEAIAKTTGIPIEDVETVISKGPLKVLKKAFKNNEIPEDAAKVISDGLNQQLESTGKVVGNIKKTLRASTTSVKTKQFNKVFKDSMDEFFKKAKGEELIPESRVKSNILDPSGRHIEKATPEHKVLRNIDFSKESGLEDDFKSLNNFMKEKFGKKTEVSLDELMQARDELSEILFTGFTRGGKKEIGKLSSKANSVLTQVRNSITDFVHSFDSNLAQADSANIYARQLRNKGAKWFDDISKGQRFLSTIDSRKLPTVDKKLIREIVNHVTGSDALLDKVRFHLANRGFDNFLGSGVANRITTGLLFGGATVGAAAGAGAPLVLGLGALTLLTSPKFVGFLLKNGDRGRIMLEAIQEIAKKQATQKAIESLQENNK